MTQVDKRSGEKIELLLVDIMSLKTDEGKEQSKADSEGLKEHEAEETALGSV